MGLAGQTSEARSGMLGTEAAAGVIVNLKKRVQMRFHRLEFTMRVKMHLIENMHGYMYICDSLPHMIDQLCELNVITRLSAIDRQ